MSRRSFLAVLALLAFAPSAKAAAPARGFVDRVLPEEPSAREARLRRVAERRAGPVIMVHRGASASAPENTLEAYAAAMEQGADGCEVDVRRTADGVLVLFHDDMLDRLTDGFGTVNQITYHRLLSLGRRDARGGRDPPPRTPTFAALLLLARESAMLLHLDVKEPGLEDDLARLLEAADVWDHVVQVNEANAARLARDPRLKPLRYKAPGLFEDRLDLDPEAVRAALARPGQMIIVDDPRLAARELRRPPVPAVPLPSGIGKDWEDPGEPAPRPGEPAPDSFLRTAALPDSPEGLIAVLLAHPEERGEPEGSEEYRRRRTERILLRARAAQRLGELGVKSAPVLRALEDQVRRRSLHRDWMYHGLDGAMACRALAALGAVESVPVLVEAFRRIDPELKKVENPAYGRHPLAWTDVRAKMYLIPALGDLPCEASKEFLLWYLGLEKSAASELAPLFHEEATRALFRQGLSAPEIESLRRSPHPAVRGPAREIQK